MTQDACMTDAYGMMITCRCLVYMEALLTGQKALTQPWQHSLTCCINVHGTYSVIQVTCMLLCQIAWLLMDADP